MRIVGVNGIATNGQGNIDVMLSYLSERGFETVDVDLPVRHTISAWWGHKLDAKAIMNATKDGDVVIAHSFGGPRVAEVMEYGRKFSAVFLFRPAMDQFYQFYQPNIYCFHSMDDWPVRIGAWLPWHPFGRAGTLGFRDPKVTNIESSGGHNADFTTHIHQRVDFVSNRLHEWIASQ